jgi:hypothetical protein
MFFFAEKVRVPDLRNGDTYLFAGAKRNMSPVEAAAARA